MESGTRVPHSKMLARCFFALMPSGLFLGFGFFWGLSYLSLRSVGI
jgi:hypothetical protein